MPGILTIKATFALHMGYLRSSFGLIVLVRQGLFQCVLKYKVGLNLLYPKIGEIGFVCYAQVGSEFEDELLFIVSCSAK